MGVSPTGSGANCTLHGVANPARGLLEHEYEYIQRLCTGCWNVQPTTGIACARTVMI